jgi:hypothetical protein
VTFWFDPPDVSDAPKRKDETVAESSKSSLDNVTDERSYKMIFVPSPPYVSGAQTNLKTKMSLKVQSRAYINDVTDESSSLKDDFRDI